MSKPHPTTVAEVAALLKSPKTEEFIVGVAITVELIGHTREHFNCSAVIDVAESLGIYPECSEHHIHPATPACLVDHFLGVYEALTDLPMAKPDEALFVELDIVAEED